MARPKKVTNSSGKKNQKDPNVVAEYETEVKFHCPKRGWVTEKIKVKKLKTLKSPPVDNKAVKVAGGHELDLDAIDDGLSIYGEEPEEEKK